MNKVDVCTDNKKGNYIDEGCYKILNDFSEPGHTASTNVHFKPCEFCKSACIDDNMNMNNSGTRILRVRTKIKNICPGKEVTVGCFVIDRCGKPLAFKAQTFIAQSQSCGSVCGESPSCCGNHCMNVNRTFVFLLPTHNVCYPLDVKVKLVANYTSPCANEL